MIVVPRQSELLDFSTNKLNMSTFMPKQTTSVIMTNSLPLQQIQQMVGRQN